MAEEKALKVLHVSTQIGWRGGEQQIMYLIRLGRDVSHYLFCPEGAALKKEAIKEGITLRTFDSSSRFQFFFEVPLQLWQFINEIHPHLIHVHDSGAHTLAYLLARRKVVASPLIVSRRVDIRRGKNMFSRKKYNQAEIAKIFCVSNYVKTIMESVVDDKSKLVTIYSGIDLQRFPYRSPHPKLRNELDIPDDFLIVGNIAALTKPKGYPIFVKTAAEILKHWQKIVFVIAGDGPMRVKIEKMILNLGLENKIILLGFRNDIPEILPSLDILLFPSENEGLGTTILDAMACGVNVVATSAGGIPEMITHQEDGLLANVGDTQQLASNVLSLARDVELRNKLRENAYKTVENFTVGNMVTQTIKTYYEILGID